MKPSGPCVRRMLLAAPSTVGGGSPRALALMSADFKTSAGLQAVVATSPLMMAHTVIAIARS